MSIMTLAIQNSILEYRAIEEEISEFYQEIHSENREIQVRNPLEKHYIRNLLMLIKWQEQADQGTPLKHIG